MKQVTAKKEQPMPVPGSLKPRPINEQELVHLLLEKFNLPAEETRAYLRLLETHDSTLDEVAEALSISVKDAGVLMERMTSKGLVIRASGSPVKFTPLHPRMTLTNIFKVYEKDVVEGLRDRRATVDRVVNLLTPIFEERKTRH